MTMKFQSFIKKISIIFLLCGICIVPFNHDVKAADVYSVIYNDVAAYQDVNTSQWITNAILYASGQYSVDPLLITAIMENESHFNINAASGAGAVGLMQLMPDTANAIGVNPYNPLDNVIGGTIYLGNQLNNFSGWGTYAVTDAVAAYNAGPQAVKNYGGVPPYTETRNYVIKVSDSYNQLLNNYQN